MQHEVFLDLLIDKLRVAPQLYTYSAQLGPEWEAEAVARWMIGELGEFLSLQVLQQSSGTNCGPISWNARVQLVFTHWTEDHRWEAVEFKVNYAQGDQYIEIKVEPQGMDSYLLEMLDFPSHEPLTNFGAIVGVTEPHGSDRIRIKSIIPGETGMRRGRRRGRRH